MGHLRYAAHILTGTATGVGIGSAVTGNALFIGTSAIRAEHANALVTVDAETLNLTLAAKWQASDDATTWFDLANEPQNPAAVVLATGTGGADPSVTTAIPAPEAIYGYKFARMALVVGGDTGTDSDTYSIGYSYRHLDMGENTDGHLRFAKHLTTGTATGVGAGSQVNGNALFMGGIEQKVAHLSALVTVDAETNTLTLAAKWQGSNDSSTWHDLAHAPHNPAAVPLATGTAGADDSVTKVVPAPASVYGYKYARCSIVVGGTTGTTSDTYSIAYGYRQRDPGGVRE